jgi:hypothetical protein
MKKTILFISLLLIFSVTLANAQTKKKRPKKKKSTPTKIYDNSTNPQFFSQNLVIAPGSMSWIPVFLVKSGRLWGNFTAQGGAKNDIQAFIVDNNGLTNLKNGNSARTFYSSGMITVDNFDLYLQPGQYFILFNNKFSVFSNKVVSVNYTIE